MSLPVLIVDDSGVALQTNGQIAAPGLGYRTAKDGKKRWNKFWPAKATSCSLT